MNRLPRDRRIVAAALLALVLDGCGGSADAAHDAPEVLLRIDGDLVVRAADLAAFDDYFEELDATMGIKYRTRELLDRHLLPLLLARRAFPREREAARQRAAALRAVAGNSLELRTKGVLAGGAETDGPVTRNQLDLPVAAWAFRPEHLGAVSDPIETAHGYVLIAPLELEPGLTPVADRLRAFLVTFPAPASEDFESWLADARRAIADRVEFVAPRLDGALPTWLRP